ncbi:hypothetical protein KFL_008230025 [Klebsormidium nitens]|uniref:Uncharacterized protein n=1 Tax=Klebsormidium nitens TaxID=105231 RepID=A0A1Y1ISK6_KLENI|nr:hypothetical protein KFL_008230025 [Klebsormidium nitens]|eukprot:GAQ91637.1 hypothetical protein KFL_008230025 [Klebsormidium nitens]
MNGGNCGQGTSGCNCFDLEVVLGLCVPCAGGVIGAEINAQCVVNGSPQGSNLFSAGTTFCLADGNGQPTTTPCDLNPTCNNAGGQQCFASGGQKCCHF